jgi:hypothetical protein
MNTRLSRIIGGVAVMGLAVGELFTGAGAARADDYGYLGGLRNAGVYIHKDAEPYVAQQGHRLCYQLREGMSSDEVAAQYPALDPAVFLSILQSQLCPDTLG